MTDRLGSPFEVDERDVRKQSSWREGTFRRHRVDDFYEFGFLGFHGPQLVPKAGLRFLAVGQSRAPEGSRCCPLADANIAMGPQDHDVVVVREEGISRELAGDLWELRPDLGISRNLRRDAPHERVMGEEANEHGCKVEESLLRVARRIEFVAAPFQLGGRLDLCVLVECCSRHPRPKPCEGHRVVAGSKPPREGRGQCLVGNELGGTLRRGLRGVLRCTPGSDQGDADDSYADPVSRAETPNTAMENGGDDRHCTPAQQHSVFR